MSAANQLPPAMAVAEFLTWDAPGSDRWELIDGAPRAMAPATPRHGAIQSELARLIGNHLAENRPGCRVIVEPGIQPRVRGHFNVRVPDLAVTCAPWNPDAKLLHDPLVVIEILSPTNQQDTWANVWSFTTIPSVLEILVLETADICAGLLRRQADGSWPSDPLLLAGIDTVTLESIGFVERLAACYRVA